MPDMLERGSQWLEDQRTQHMTRTVTYRRGSATVEVQATIGQTVFRLNDAYGATVRYVSRDFLIAAADLVIPPDTDPTLPRRADEVLETDGQGVVHVHEVMGPGSGTSGGEPDWRFSDPYRRTLRIHTKATRTE